MYIQQSNIDKRRRYFHYTASKVPLLVRVIHVDDNILISGRNDNHIETGLTIYRSTGRTMSMGDKSITIVSFIGHTID